MQQPKERCFICS